MKFPALISALLFSLAAYGQGKGAIIPTQGTVHIPVIVLEFSDVKLSVEDPEQHFGNMLNQEGYSAFEATGSVADYFRDNSAGRFRPVFDVYGPVTLAKKMAAYGKDIIKNGERIDDTAPEMALTDACTILDNEVDFSEYDADGDGTIDLVIFYFAGYDQADGGPADAIWSHHWNACIQEENIENQLFDGVSVGPYFCASELRGGQGLQPCGIGPSCHELAHALGLPDLYDTDGGTGGYAGGLYGFSLMGSGLYNNAGRTPPHLNALELNLLGWRGEIPVIPSGQVSVGPVQRGAAFRIPTETEGEFFILESRDGSRWDSPLPEGLLIYHVDMSDGQLWENWREHNAINSDGSHPCFYLIPSSDPASLNYASAFNPSSIIFPGSSRRLWYDPVDWKGERGGVQITNIHYSGGESHVTVLRDAGANVNGTVLNTSGAAVSGVKVSAGDLFTETDASGFFMLPIADESRSFSLEFSKSGYEAHTQEVSLLEGERTTCIMAVLHTPGEAKTDLLSKYDSSGTSAYYPVAGAIGAVKFSADELAGLSGRQLRSIDFYPNIGTLEGLGDLYVTVDFGPVRVLSFKVENPSLGEFKRVSANISEANLRIPEGIDVYVGYGFSEAGENYPISVVYPGSKGNSYWSEFSLEGSSWNEMYSATLGHYMDIMLSASASEVPGKTLADLGYTTIDTGNGNFRAGELFSPSLILPAHLVADEVQWSWDSARLRTEGAFRLVSGEHLLEAVVRYADGRSEKLSVKINVN